MPDTSIPIPVTAIKGRGSATRHPHRFVRDAREAFDDGWEPDPEAGDVPPPATTVTWEEPRSAISWNGSPDVYFDRGLNPYRGCEHVMWRQILLLEQSRVKVRMRLPSFLLTTFNSVGEVEQTLAAAELRKATCELVRVLALHETTFPR